MNIEAYDVNYSTGGSTGSMIVLVDLDNGDTVEEALAHKVRAYSIGSACCKINYMRKITLSEVRIGELSINEFLMIANM